MLVKRATYFLAVLTATWLAIATAPICRAQQQDQQQGTQTPPTAPPASTPESDEQADQPLTTFPHSETSRFWVSGQANIIFQWHPAFNSPYSGPNSLSASAQSATSRVFTLYTGVQLTRNTEIIFAPESAGGTGIGSSVGLAGYTNLDVVRICSDCGTGLTSAPYISRLYLHQVIPLPSGRESRQCDPTDLLTSLPVRRLEFRIGKFSLADFFDANSAGSNSHLQFLNWTIDDNGAWDYAADTRGYTFGAEFEYHDRWGALLFAEAMMPTIANGINLDGDLARARSENFEADFHSGLIPRRPTIVRLLNYENTANMGSYREAINDYFAGETSTPDIISTRRQGRLKYGFGVNLEQLINDWLTAFGRWGWNNGRTESFVYTEVDRTISGGIAATGNRWRRSLDHAGAAFVSNAISGDHRLYLELGGDGFLLGDGRLNYGHEDILELFYTAHLWRGLFAAFDLQHINNPGYNRDRGPVLVPALRAHIDF
jgi:high affinity Mn2+ porin